MAKKRTQIDSKAIIHLHALLLLTIYNHHHHQFRCRIASIHTYVLNNLSNGGKRSGKLFLSCHLSLGWKIIHACNSVILFFYCRIYLHLIIKRRFQDELSHQRKCDKMWNIIHFGRNKFISFIVDVGLKNHSCLQLSRSTLLLSHYLYLIIKRCFQDELSHPEKCDGV